MGCAPAKFVPDTDDVRGQGPKCMQLFKDLDLGDKDVAKLYQAFLKTDMNNDRNVDVGEFITRNKIECETLARLLMRLQDADASGKCLFQAFVVVFWAVCSSSESTLPSLILALFDVDSTGELERAEITFLAQLMANFTPKPNTIAAIKYLEYNFTRTVKLEEYTQQTHQTRELFSGALEMQRMLQDRTLGLYQWKILTNKRAKKWPSKTSFDILAKSKALGLTKEDVAQMKIRALGREIPEPVYRNERTPAVLKEKITRARALAKKERDAVHFERDTRLKKEAERQQRERDQATREQKAKTDAAAKEVGKREKILREEKAALDGNGVWFNKTTQQHLQTLEAEKLAAEIRKDRAIAEDLAGLTVSTTDGEGGGGGSGPGSAQGSPAGASSPAGTSNASASSSKGRKSKRVAAAE